MSTSTAVPISTETDAQAIVAGLVTRARAAMAQFADADQARVDEAVTALAWSLYKPDHAKSLAIRAVAEIGLGNVESKITKNTRKTFGTLRDLMRVKTVGIIEEDPAKGLVKWAKPVGVVAAITPSTNPSATPVNKAMMAIKGRNAVIVAPSPAASGISGATVDLMRAELAKIGLPRDLVQILPAPVNRQLTTALMKAVDLVVCTGSQNNVRGAYSSGTPAIGVGAGNVPVIIDEGADLDAAAEMIRDSKIFDNATSCSSENSVVIPEAIYEDAIAALERAGAWRATEYKHNIQAALWPDGSLSRTLIARDADVFAEGAGLPEAAKSAKFFLVEDDGIGPGHPFSGEKLSLVLTVYKARDWADAKRLVRDILNHQGRGHSCGIHTRNMDHARELAAETDAVRVLVNQAHTFGNGGGFNNGLPFTLSMGCGTWAGNSIDDNLNWRSFVNITHLVTTIPEDKPAENELFGAYWEKYGK
ncbi:MAG: aldehyde dehydrogenase family protein [Proteobacteria bacterium]|nr:aldehyde dehydrogenase family protein [Pseudomonadota bacterium]